MIPLHELKEVEAAGRRALNILVAQNLGLVMSIVRKYEDKGVQASDLVQVPTHIIGGAGEEEKSIMTDCLGD